MFDVAIIGYGPVGAVLANLLGQDGWRVVVLETSHEIFPIPRAVHMDDEAQRILQTAGVLDLVKPSFGGYPPDRQYINAKGKVFFETHLRPDKPFGHQSNMYFHQPMLEEGLRAGVERFANVEIHLKTQATALHQDKNSVSVETEHVETGTSMMVEARYVIGCDGARSFVRKSLGIGFRDLKFEQPWLVTDFYLKPGLTRDDVGFPYAHQQICNPQQPISFIPNGTKNHYRFEFMLPKGVTKESAEQEAYVHKMLSQVVDLDKIDIVRGAVYTFHSLIAEQWRDRRVFLAGDAAHQMPPFAGQGMCSGLRDVQNLSWKLGLVLGGISEASLLDSYEQERKPHVTRMTQGTMFLGNLVQTQNPLRSWLRDVLFGTVFKIPAFFRWIASFALRPPPLRSALYGGTVEKAVGTYFPQPEVTDGGGQIGLLDEHLGQGFAVVGIQEDPSPYFKSVVEKLSLNFIVVGRAELGADTVQITDHTGMLDEWFANHNADFVIIRPDRFVFGAYSVAGISDALHELMDQLKAIAAPKNSHIGGQR